MIRKSVKRFSLAANAERVCAEIMLKTESAMTIQPDLIALWKYIGAKHIGAAAGRPD